jgi:hypothetical protein
MIYHPLSGALANGTIWCSLLSVSLFRNTNMQIIYTLLTPIYFKRLAHANIHTTMHGKLTEHPHTFSCMQFVFTFR